MPGGDNYFTILSSDFGTGTGKADAQKGDVNMGQQLVGRYEAEKEWRQQYKAATGRDWVGYHPKGKPGPGPCACVCVRVCGW